MNHCHKHKGLVAFLIMLLLSNSSLALESLSHSAHQAADSHEVHSMHVMSVELEPSAASMSLDASDECICDLVCCPSSIDFGFITPEEQHSGDVSNSFARLALYQSISLDLLLPPPTR